MKTDSLLSIQKFVVLLKSILQEMLVHILKLFSLYVKT